MKKEVVSPAASAVSPTGPWEVIVSDPIDPKGLESLAQNKQFRVHFKPKIAPAELDALLPSATCWLVRSETKVTDALMAKAPRLKVVGRAGVGVDNIDVDAATRRGVLVMNVPGANTLAAAEHAFALLLSLARNIPQAHSEVAAGKWERAKWTGSELAGKTLGVVGLGRIGREVTKRALAFEMKVLAFDPFVSTEFAAALGVETVDLKGLLGRSDFITLHASLSDKTRHLLNRETIGWLKPGARLVNCARGELIEEGALLEALKSGQLRGAALDVFAKEPLPADSPLRGVPNLVLTPHLGASTEEAQERVASELARNVADYLEKGILRAAVNLPGFDPAALEASGPYLELAERLGRFASQVLEGGLQEVQVHCEGAFDPQARHPIGIAAVKGLLSNVLDERGVSWVNASLLAAERGLRIVESAEQRSPEGFARLLTLSVRTEAGTQRVSGAVTPQGAPRLVRLGSLVVEVPLEGKMIVLTNSDRPGMIGKVGTLLGKHGINIADMRVGRRGPRGHAAMVITVDEDLPAEALRELRAIDGIEKVHFVTV